MNTISFVSIRKEALRLGLDDLGIVRASESATWNIFSNWLDSGQAGEMEWLAKLRDARRHPNSVLPGVQTLFAAALSLRRIQKTEERPLPRDESRPHTGVNSYAVCTDYHTILRDRLRGVARTIAPLFPDEKFRVAVDTAPLLEKEWAARSGLGRIAKNSMLLHPWLGTDFFLGFLLTTVPFEAFTEIPAIPEPEDPCAECDRCRKACPTGALNSNRTLNATQCVNYWGIEYRGDEIPEKIVPLLRRFPFGCDLCRRVCPRNPELPPRPEVPLDLTEEEFKTLFKGTPAQRLGYERFRRNSGE
ncbi:MAG: tRNA epoxyqueuosine(34) reductase QueG [Thermoguttaceae bacterium]|nr:tRNA epoxyqueuosine(34) reductase QueG [Thermoguttaceae bacterium]